MPGHPVSNHMGDRAAIILSFFILAVSLPAQTRLTGHINPRIAGAIDQGRADSSLRMEGMMLMLKPTAAQQADLDQFLTQLQDPSSHDYHRFLTPEQYAIRFGAAQTDIDKLTAWLTGANLNVVSVARGRNEITFSGNVRDVESALGTEIHRYSLNGELHFANATEPSVPVSMEGLVLAIHGLHDFKLKPRVKVRPKYTSGSSGFTTLSPGDVAAIYDVKPLWNSGV